MALVWAKHRHAERYLAGMSFAESVFFPVPPDVMLAPMSLAQPDKAWRFASFTTIASVIGGILGYLLGFWLFEPVVEPLIAQMGWQAKFDTALSWFENYGVWVVFLAGFSPIPYKVFTIGAGLMQMAFLPFLIASDTGVMQARPLAPFIFIPSEPQTPSRQERRIARLASVSFNNSRTSSTIKSLPWVSTS